MTKRTVLKKLGDPPSPPSEAIETSSPPSDGHNAFMPTTETLEAAARVREAMGLQAYTDRELKSELERRAKILLLPLLKWELQKTTRGGRPDYRLTASIGRVARLWAYPHYLIKNKTLVTELPDRCKEEILTAAVKDYINAL